MPVSGTRNRLVEELSDAGAKSFVSKVDGTELLRAAIRFAAEHKPFFTPSVSELRFRRFVQESGAPRSASPELTQRERHIIEQIAQGKSSKEIGAALGISSRTAETHRAAILRKLGVSSTAEIVRYPIRAGIVEA